LIYIREILLLASILKGLRNNKPTILTYLFTPAQSISNRCVE